MKEKEWGFFCGYLTGVVAGGVIMLLLHVIITRGLLP